MLLTVTKWLTKTECGRSVEIHFMQSRVELDSQVSHGSLTRGTRAQGPLEDLNRPLAALFIGAVCQSLSGSRSMRMIS
jgi:hypothetical protein